MSAATGQLDNQRTWSGLSLRSLLKGDQARELDYAKPALGFSRRVQTTVLPPEAAPLRATVIIDAEETAERTAESPQRARLSMLADGSRADWRRSVMPSPVG